MTSESDGTTEGTWARTAVGQRHNVDLARVRIDRSPQGAAEAFRRQARGFTTDRSVVIPTSAGSLDSGPGEALLAHELTHVAQRVRYGPTLPDESTPAGQVLEAEARTAELVLGAGLLGRPTPPRTPEPSTWSAALANRATSSDAAPPLPLAATAPAAPSVDALAASIVDRISQPPGPATGEGQVLQFGPSSWATGAASMAVGPAPAASPAWAAIQRAPDESGLPPAAGPSAAPAGPDEHAGANLSRPSEEDLTNLSRWLYPLIKYRLKGELR